MMIEWLMIGSGIMVLCYARAIRILDGEPKVNRSIPVIVIDLLTMIVAVPLLKVMALYEEYTVNRKMRAIDNKEEFV